MSHNWRNYKKKNENWIQKNTKDISLFFGGGNEGNTVPSTSSSVSTDKEITEIFDQANVSHVTIPVDEHDEECHEFKKSKGEQVDSSASLSGASVLSSDEVTSGLTVSEPGTVSDNSTKPRLPSQKAKVYSHDGCLFSEAKYQNRFQWVYYSHCKKGYICKYCFYIVNV